MKAVLAVDCVDSSISSGLAGKVEEAYGVERSSRGGLAEEPFQHVGQIWHWSQQRFGWKGSPIWQLGRILSEVTSWVTQLVQCTPLWPAARLSAVDKSRGFTFVEFQRVWEAYDDPVQFMAVPDALRLDDALRREDVSDAWTVWSGGAGTALAVAFCSGGCPVPDRGLVIGRGLAQFMLVRLGGPEVRKARNTVADPLDGGDAFMYRNSTIAPRLDMRRRLKAVLDVPLFRPYGAVGVCSWDWSYVPCQSG